MTASEDREQHRSQEDEALRRAIKAGQVIGFRIMRETEVAAGWWGQPSEVGETGSATVADSFCRDQNATTMDPNRSKRIRYFAEPIYETAPLPPAAECLASSRIAPGEVA